MLQVLPWRVFPDNFILRCFGWNPLLQAPLCSALQREGLLQSSHQDCFTEEKIGYCFTRPKPWSRIKSNRRATKIRSELWWSPQATSIGYPNLVFLFALFQYFALPWGASSCMTEWEFCPVKARNYGSFFFFFRI